MKRMSIKEETAITTINESDFVLEEDLKVYLRKNLDLISQLNEGSEDRRKAG